MALNKHIIAALLAEKSKQQGIPAYNNIKSVPVAAPYPNMPTMPTPGFKPTRFAMLKQKLGYGTKP